MTTLELLTRCKKRLDTALKDSMHTKRVAAGISIELTDTERTANDTMNQLLSTSATHELPDDDATTTVCSDASDCGWSVIVTQVTDFISRKPVRTQQHKLLTRLSGAFKGSQLNWT
ncbi:hypothetical protein L916_12775 [Phytophthora nicotianae]|uniref:Reverse transcriptase/retrotransposon-derived protein RNase H-like domain-containing protein n=1 Tax=Phytophthora nicotianae TaxID=4792 RepID=W2INF1_PHYNI|nr:hypothetical protein L916_12775 [Phytophthora nicotianae]